MIYFKRRGSVSVGGKETQMALFKFMDLASFGRGSGGKASSEGEGGWLTRAS